MITRISIENFKGIGERVDIPIRPITLLFGPNSAGKSTILHAIQYAREVLERHNLDADKTMNGGDFVDLGGFRNFVNGHDEGKPVILRFDLDLTGIELPQYRPRAGYNVHFEVHSENFNGPLTPDDERTNPSSGWVEVTIRWSRQQDMPYVSAYTVGADGKPVGTIEFQPGRPQADLTVFDLDHQVFQCMCYVAGEEYASIGLVDASYSRATGLARSYPREDDQATIALHGQVDALPHWRQPLDMPSLFPDETAADDMEGRSVARSEENRGGAAERALQRREEEDDRVAAGIIFTEEVSRVMLGMGQVLMEHLREFRYLGPLREIPGRNHEAPRFYDEARWANGLGAWDELLTAPDEFVDEVSRWLDREDRLDTGYALHRIEYRERETWVEAQMRRGEMEEGELETDTVKRRIRLTDVAKDVEVDAQDVGVGLAQVIPVITAVLSEKSKVVEIEQPGLHLHPAQQAAIGDLFIRSALSGTGKLLLLETHSEHLILRLLRRIREKAEGTLVDESLSLTPDDLAVICVTPDGGQTKISHIEVDKNGELVGQWPGGFFEERAKELF